MKQSGPLSRVLFAGVLTLMTGMIVLVTLLALFTGQGKTGRVNSSTAATRPAGLRVGLIPERDIFEQNRRHRILGDYLASKLGTPVELVTARSYDQILADLKDGSVDAAFLGSLVTVLAVDRTGAEIVAKPHLMSGKSTYHGVIFVLESSKVTKVEELNASSVAIVRTTTGGNLFLIDEMARRGILSPSGTGQTTPRLVWVGTHDDVIDNVVVGHADAGAVKDVRLDEYLARHPEVHVRRLAESGEVPENALVIRGDLPASLKAKLRESVLNMHRDPAGADVLKQFGCTEFLPCSLQEYSIIFDMVDDIHDQWNLVGIDGPAPKRPRASATSPSTQWAH